VTDPETAITLWPTPPSDANIL